MTLRHVRFFFLGRGEVSRVDKNCIFLGGGGGSRALIGRRESKREKFYQFPILLSFQSAPKFIFPCENSRIWRWRERVGRKMKMKGGRGGKKWGGLAGSGSLSLSLSLSFPAGKRRILTSHFHFTHLLFLSCLCANSSPPSPIVHGADIPTNIGDLGDNPEVSLS